MTTSQAISKKLKFWRISTFWVMLLGYVGYYLCRKNLPAAFPLLTDEFGYTNGELGLIAGYSEIAYALGKFVNGPLADKIGGKKIFLTGMVGAIVFNVAFAMSSSLPAFIVIWCLCRYFLSMGWGGIAKTIGNWYPPERNGTIMGLISINFQFGGVVATLFAGYLVALGVGWQGVFLYPAAVLSGIFIWAALASKDHPKSVDPNTEMGHSPIGKKQLVDYGEDENQLGVFQIMKGLLKLNLFRQLLFFSFLTTLLRSVFFFWTPKLLVDLGMGNTSAILKSALFPFLGALGTVLLGWYTDKYAKNGDRARMMWIMLLCLTLSLVAVAYLSEAAQVQTDLIVLVIGLCGFFLLGPYSMTSGCLTLDIAGPHGAGSSTGMLDGIGYIGGALAAWGAGELSETLGWAQVFQLLALFAALSTFSAYMMSRQFQKIAKEKSNE